MTPELKAFIDRVIVPALVARATGAVGKSAPNPGKAA